MRVLVVEDEHRIAATLKKGLEQERITVDLAYDGEAGYDLAAENVYDVIVLDVLLPKLDGISLCKKLRETPIHTPILLLTAKSQIQDKVTGLRSGADDYLTKPFSFDELLARLHALNRRPRVVMPHLIVEKDLTINLQNYEVCRQGKKIELSAKEYALLEFLMRHAHQIVSKNRIIQHVWSYEADILENTVEVFICHLRDKIDRPFPHQPSLIHTVRGFGYRLGD